MKTGWLIYNGGLVSKKYIEINELYKEAANKKGIDLVLVKNNEIFSVIEKDKPVAKSFEDRKKPDFVLFLDKDVRMARHLEKVGFKLFNSSETIISCDDKILTYQILSNNNIRIPKSIFSQKMYVGTKDLDTNFVDFIEEELSYPLVIKEAFGSFGAQVYLVKDRDELLRKRNELLYIPHIYQEFISTSEGRDVRLHVVGEKVVASMLRSSEVDFRANVSNGGKMFNYEPSKEFVDLAINASKLLEADFTGVDILFGENDEPVICEINSNAHIKNICDCTGINVADHIFDYILERLKND